MKKILFLTTLIVIMAIGVGLYVVHAPTYKPDYRIAIITPVSHQALERVEEGFKTTFDALARGRVFYKTFNAQGKKTIMRAQIDEALSQPFDVIVTLASGPTMMTQQRIRKSGAHMPQVFAAVAKPKRNGMVQDTAITGVTGDYNPELQVKALMYFRPTTKTALIVYDPSQTPELHHDADAASVLLAARGVTVSKAEITGVADLASKIPSLLDGVDVVLVLNDNTVVSGIDVLVKLCTQRGITLVVSDLESGVRGAVLAVGVREEAYGQLAAQQAFDVVVNKKPARAIAYRCVDQLYVQVNMQTMVAQQLTTPATLNALEKTCMGKEVVCVQLP